MVDEMSGWICVVVAYYMLERCQGLWWAWALLVCIEGNYRGNCLTASLLVMLLTIMVLAIIASYSWRLQRATPRRLTVDRGVLVPCTIVSLTSLPPFLAPWRSAAGLHAIGLGQHSAFAGLMAKKKETEIGSIRAWVWKEVYSDCPNGIVVERLNCGWFKSHAWKFFSLDE